MYDVEEFRARFPALQQGVAHFDGPGGSQVPIEVAAAVSRTLTSPIANRGSVTAAEQLSEGIVHESRQALADLLGADPVGIVFGRSMTELTFSMARTLAKTWAPGDEVVVSRLDHDANLRPWICAAEAVGARVRWADFDPFTTELPVDSVADQLTDRTRLVAVTAASNLVGTRPDIPAIAAAAHHVGALLFVDGVHFTAHCAADLDALGADFFACSPYKFLGPHCGVLAAAPALLQQLEPDKLLPSSNAVPERFELGTLPYELMAGTTAAIDVLASLGYGDDRRSRLLSGMLAVEEHEDRLRLRLEDGLEDLPGTVLRSRAARRTPTLLLTFANRAATGAYRFLASRSINAPAGSFYALEASRWLGLGEAGGLRIGLAPYTNDDDIDRLLAALAEFVDAGSLPASAAAGVSPR